LTGCVGFNIKRSAKLLRGIAVDNFFQGGRSYIAYGAMKKTGPH
jgi:hypothetical protein